MKKLLSLLLCTVLVLTCLAGLTFAADPECTYTVSGTEGEQTGTLQEAFAAISAKGGTVTMLRDVELDTSSEKWALRSESTAVTIDLGGHTLKGPRLISVGGKGVPGVAHIKNGTVISEMMAMFFNNGGIHLENLTVFSDQQQCVSYNDYTGDYNEQNLIENCTIASTAWGAFSFNNTSKTQEKVCVTIRNSTLAALKESGNQTIVRQSAAMAANVELGENVTLLTYHKTAAIAGGIRRIGGTPELQAETTPFTVADRTFEGLNVWKTSAEGAAAPAVPENPLDRVHGYTPEVSSDAETEVTPEAPAEVPETPAEEVPDTVVVKQTADYLAVADVILSALCVVLLVILLVKKKK